MVVKLNSHTLLDNSIDKMKAALNRSRDIIKEVGSTMCSNKDGIIILRNEQEGEPHQITINRQCDIGEEYVGYYHTHHGTDSHASSVDLRLCGTSKILCSGGYDAEKLKEGQRIDNVGCYIWKDKLISVQEGDQVRAEVLAEKREPSNPAYRQHFGCLDTIGRYADEQERLDNELKSIVFDPFRKLPLTLRFQELNKMVERETDKYYNIINIKL